MSQQIIAQFISEMTASGCAPAHGSDILATDKKTRYQMADEKAGKKTGEYQLKIDNGFGFGWFKSYREGIVHKFSSKSDRKFTPEEKAEWKAKTEAAKKAKDAELAALRTKAAKTANYIWERAARDGGSDYLARKGVGLNGARIHKGLVTVPVRVGPDIVSLQFVSSTGDKRFLSDGQKDGGYFSMAKGRDDLSVIVIAEGFATAASIREITGLPVIVAFDAGNLKPVARALRVKYPGANFIFAADNDQWTFNPKHRPSDIQPSEISGDDERWTDWRDRGWLVNAGVEKAMDAAASIGGAAVIWPDFSGADARKRTDFNDLYLTEGAAAVSNKFLAIKFSDRSPEGVTVSRNDRPAVDVSSVQSGDTSEIPNYDDYADYVAQMIPLEAYDEETREVVKLYSAGEHSKPTDWREKLHFNDKGKINSKSLSNALLFIENDEVLSNLFCYDEFLTEKIVYRCPPWQDAKDFEPRPLTDNDMTYLTAQLEKRGIIQPIHTVKKLVDASIRNNSRNPAVEYFKSIVWDKTKRLHNWLSFYCGAEYDDTEYLAAVGTKWLCAVVARVLNPGCKFDSIIVFEGEQGAMKSLMLKEMATIHGQAYFDDTVKISDLGTAAVIPKLQGVLIVEIAEMSGMRKKDVDELKQAITTTHDRIVQKYSNEASRWPRKFVFAGTINPLDGYLTDPTGNRRFWPVRVGKKIDIDAIIRDKEQLFAEAVYLYNKGEKLFLDDALFDKAKSVQTERNVQHPWHEELDALTRSVDKIEVEEVWNALGITDRTRRTRFAADDIAKIMLALGFERSRRRFDGDLKYAWVRKDQPPQPMKQSNDLELDF